VHIPKKTKIAADTGPVHIELGIAAVF